MNEKGKPYHVYMLPSSRARYGRIAREKLWLEGGFSELVRLALEKYCKGIVLDDEGGE